jgi:rhodanese-related sulfurtransferase
MNSRDESSRFEVEGIVHINNPELQKLIQNSIDRTIVIDVREPEEYDERHIPGVPLIPMGEIIDIIEQFDSERAYVFVCRSGRRSLEVAKFFQANGINQVMNFAGGMLNWTGEVATGLERLATTGYAKDLEPLK